MNEHKKICREMRVSERGNAMVATLVILVVAAVGFFAYKSGKLDMNKGDSSVSGLVETAATDDTEAPKNENPVLAKLYGDEIKRQDVFAFVNTMPAQMRQIPADQLFMLALEQIINNKIVDQNAKSSGLGNDADVLKKLEDIKTQIVRNKFLENAVKSKLTEERLKAKYEAYLADFPEVEEVKVAHILVENEKLAKTLIGKLKKGAVFADVAKENSQDGSAENGGELGYFSKTDVVPAFAEAAFALEPGTYSKTPVKTDFGFHIIKVDEKRKRPPAQFAEVKPYMEQELQRVILDEMIQELRADVDIERFDLNGNPIAKTEPAAGSEDVKTGDVSAEADAVESVDVSVEDVAPEAGSSDEGNALIESVVE
ncbi:MAG: rotamase [Zetaproteobacteria bacterium]|nr:MAG: rotamase [Zetaproteobacteria bacterium]